MKKIAFILVALFTIYGATAQQIFKGGGTSGSTFLFSYPSYCAKSQCIFLPAELTNATSGNIVRLYYRYGTNNTGQTMNGFKIMMGQTTATSFTASGANYNFFTGLTTVLDSTDLTIPAGTSGNWFSIDLQNPFTYDATKTLIIQLTFATCAQASWLTLGTNNTPVRKVITPTLTSATGSGTSSTWQDMGFDLGQSVFVTEISDNNTALLYPNPVKNTEQLFWNGKIKPSLIKIYNLAGVLVSSIQPSGTNIPINTHEVSAGIYFVEVYDGDRLLKKQKLVVE